MGKYFGTDGIRGLAGQELRAEHAYKIGHFLGRYYGAEGKRARCVVGKDTRLSSNMLECALASGLSEGGADTYLLGVITTPAVSYITDTEGLDFGIMISASHNPFYDNGIKIFNGCGEKLEDFVISKIENYLDSRELLPFAKGEEIGKIIEYKKGRGDYQKHLMGVVKSSFKGLKIGLDLSNGSASFLAARVFEGLGAPVYSINDQPNGININCACGSTDPKGLQRLVLEKGLDMGFAFDGDGDRCIAVSERGEIIDGDFILYILGRDLHERGRLRGGCIVTTVMSNFGLYTALDNCGISYVQSPVGDRFVYEKMKERGCSLGGEQSGHIILSDYGKTGDGILTALRVADVVRGKGKALSSLASLVKALPQKTRSVFVKDKCKAMEGEEFKRAVDNTKKMLDGKGQLLVRPSGTESAIRITVWAKSDSECTDFIEKIAKTIEKEDNLQWKK